MGAGWAAGLSLELGEQMEGQMKEKRGRAVTKQVLRLQCVGLTASVKPAGCSSLLPGRLLCS